MLDKIMQAMRGRQAGAGRGFVNPPSVEELERGKRRRMEEFEATPEDVSERKQMRKDEEAYERARTTYKKGGKVSSASKRADGIAERGKTRGTTITMCGGGYMKGK